ncbi:MAG: hypothetical protein OXG58_01895 [Gemmatimonadetes bacterium]|nr:hypothetical protein [Gemmatimonadota bacterium]MCY3943503.1 hypothetical protein [Gemmatimonadota bacterium]
MTPIATPTITTSLWRTVPNTSFFPSAGGGGSWKNVTPPAMPEFGRVSLIGASAFDAGRSPWSSPREHRDR